MNAVLIVAHKEFRDGFRSRWTVAIAGLFAALALAISYFGAVTAGRVGFTSFDATIASLTTLTAFLIPLIGLLISYDGIIGEREGGTLALMLSYPLSRTELASGKFLGHSAVLAVAILAGFGIAVTLVQIMTPSARTATAWFDIMRFAVSAILLGASFTGMGSAISVWSRDKGRAAGLALLIWAVVVLLFDLLLLAILVISGGNSIERAVYPYLLLLNPVDVFRLVNLLALGEGTHGDIFMAMTGARVYHPGILYGALLAWTAGPFALALAGFRKQDV